MRRYSQHYLVLSVFVVATAQTTPLLAQGRLEGEALKIVEKTGGETATFRSARYNWSGQKQLAWHKALPGHKLVLAIPVEEAGKYVLKANLTKAPDYAIVRFSIDDKPLGEPIDLFNDGVITTGKIALGTVDLTAGQYRLSLEITGSNPKARPGDVFQVGLDYVCLEQPILGQPIDDQRKVEYLTKYAPQVFFHTDEDFFPSSVEWSFQYLNRQWSDARAEYEIEKGWYLVPKQHLENPGSLLHYFYGAHPKKPGLPSLKQVPAYAFWSEVDKETVDLFYWFYYPYNRGKVVGGILGVGETVIGNHVGDWEHITVRLTRQQDAQGQWTLAPLMDKHSIHLAAHKDGRKYTWREVKVGQRFCGKEGTEHPVIFSAKGSHGSYLGRGDHPYERWAPGENLGRSTVDSTNAGAPWHTWTNLECFDWNRKRGLGPTWKGTWPPWLEQGGQDRTLGGGDPSSGPSRRWGTTPNGYVDIPFVGRQWRLAHGPKGPADQMKVYADNLMKLD